MTSDEPEKPWPELRTVSAQELETSNYNEVVSRITSADYYDLERAFLEAAKLALALNDEVKHHSFRVLAGICSMHLNVDDPANKFGAKMVLANGSRTPVPEDYLGDQNEELYQILSAVTHPALRARLADIVWTNNKRKGQAAGLAVEAYCECIERILDGSFTHSVDEPGNIVTIEMTEFLERAAQIHYGSSKRSAPMHERVSGLIDQLFALAIESKALTELIRLATLALRYKIIDPASLAPQIETTAVAAEVEQDAYPIGTQKLFDIAAFAYGDAGDLEAARRCRLASAEQNVKMAPVTGSSAAAAHWYRQAIKAFKTIEGTGERREELRKELRVLQEKSLEEVSSFSTPVDLGDLIEETLREFDRLSLSEALKSMAFMSQPEVAQKLREIALTTQYGLTETIFSSSHLDDQGKVIAEVESAPLHGGQPSEEWIRSKIVQHVKIRIYIVLNSRLEPARSQLGRQTSFSGRHFEAIVQSSPFVPDTHRATITLGLARLFQGDILSAGPLLIPQLEHCVRHVLQTFDVDASRMRDDLIQEDRSLSAMCDQYRDDLVRIFGENIVLYIELLFINRPGPALRHEFAHGKIGDQTLYDEHIRYACYFVYYLVCAPLFDHWDEFVEPYVTY